MRDLLFTFPRRYDDFSAITTIRQLPADQPGTAVVEVIGVRVEQTFRRRVQRTTAYLRDETGEAEATWFGRRFIEKRLRTGDRVVMSGRVVWRGFLPRFENPAFEPVGARELVHTGRIVPVYRLTAGITNPWLRSAIHRVLERFAAAYPDYLPAAVREKHGLVPLGRALFAVHFPEAFAARDAALHRFAFDELLALQTGMVSRARRRRAELATSIGTTEARFAAIVASLQATLAETIRRRRTAAAAGTGSSAAPAGPAEPTEPARAELTRDQRAALAAIRADLAARRPMLRLLQGDVGSGKTAVAAAALAMVADAARQGALLAPTDLLARQHAATLTAFLEPLGHRVTLLVGSLPAARRHEALELLAAPPAELDPEGRSLGRVVVGTHALVQEAVAFAELSLVVVDEQHRFGVAERERLVAKGTYPHVLLMTATPIPRTLGQVFHADLDVTDLRTPPAGRLRVRTGVRRPDELMERDGDPKKGTFPLLAREVAAGRRAFVVVPLVEEDPESGAIATEAAATLLTGRLPEAARRIGLSGEPRFEIAIVHGQMKARERDAAMDRFRAGEVNVLVGTTVVEVGVDVPEATVMLILDADRFGVAQLHQLRGRVGRGEDRSYCVLVSSSEDGTARERLKALEENHDGFKLAEMDFELRREGDVLGIDQSGLPRLRVASLQRAGDRDLSVAARTVAETMVDAAGRLRDDPGWLAFRRELEAGWLAQVGSGEASADA